MFLLLCGAPKSPPSLLSSSFSLFIGSRFQRKWWTIWRNEVDNTVKGLFLKSIAYEKLEKCYSICNAYYSIFLVFHMQYQRETGALFLNKYRIWKYQFRIWLSYTTNSWYSWTIAMRSYSKNLMWFTSYGHSIQRNSIHYMKPKS